MFDGTSPGCLLWNLGLPGMCSIRAYNTATGGLVLLIGGGLSVIAYRVMKRIARVPVDRRVLR